MAIDDRCNPKKKAHFAGMLDEIGFDYTGLKVKELMNPKTKVVSSNYLTRDGKDLVLILLPGLGTSVIAHTGEKAETVQYLGTIVSGAIPHNLKYKFQNDYATDRDESHDEFLEFSSGQTFVTIGKGRPGLWHGYHNSDKKNPVALRIRKEF